MQSFSFDPHLHHQIAACTQRALDWMEGQLHFFNPFANLPDVEAMDMKSMTELALLVGQGIRLGVVGSRKQAKRLGQFLLDITASDDLTSIVVDNQLFVMSYTLVEEVRQLMNRSGTGRNRFTQDMVDTRYVLGVDRSPYRKMDLAYSLGRVGIQHDLPSMAELYAATILSHPVTFASLSLDDVYAITHTIFYLTDMGHELPKWMDSAELQRLRHINQNLMRIYLRDDNLDVLGELVLCQLQLHDPVSAETIISWQRIVDGQAESGFIPSPTFRTQDLTTCKLEEQARYIFDNSYHTTLVIIMAGLLWLKRYQLPLAVSKIPELSSLINKQ